MLALKGFKLDGNDSAVTRCFMYKNGLINYFLWNG